LLENLKAEESRAVRARLKIFFGAAPGVGKTYAMLQEANAAVVRVMALARALDGVISGEHGIGITKLEFLTDAELAPFAEYKPRARSRGVARRGRPAPCRN